ncbi:accessory gene regulator AgrB [Staphylococcus massiliensis]|uniref:accessory gene regulator AgrB n=1 Tax=Staphylococcus massiliensis TaxID=555791 RepID=UPI001EE0EA74|nr:accessory gene regulator AgrB [Staphylococcus massiliensis]MCG3402885.1 accessory gene regulator AgrB [Staphylococcus massiliensis]
MQKLLDTWIDKFALTLQKKNNLDRISYLKIRLGIQIVLGNLFKGIVVYGLALLLNIFFYTLTVHLFYFVLRFFAHGAHAKSSFLCHVQNLLIFILLPWLIVHFEIPYTFFFVLSLISLIMVILLAPAATRKLPIKESRKKRKKVRAIITTIVVIALSFFVQEPYQQLMLTGIVIEAITLLPIFFPKEDK